MDIKEAYYLFVEEINKNAVNDNIASDPYRFILHLNKAQYSLMETYLERRNEDDIRHLSKFLKTDTQLKLKNTFTEYSAYKLPEDYFDFSNLKVYASNESCDKQRLHTFEIKTENIEELLRDEYNKPSFKYRETFYNFSDDNVNVYKDNFNIDDVRLTYYRYPKKADLEGYIHPTTNKVSVNSDLEWDDKMAIRVITLAASNYMLANDDSKFQPARQLATI